MTEQEKMSVQPITSVDQILNVVKSRETAYASHYWVPSLKKEVKFKELNTSQQKRLIKSIIDSPVYNTEFICTFRDILKENCIDQTVNIDELTIIDKLMLAIGLRTNCIGKDVAVEITPKEGVGTISVNIDLFKVFEIAKEKLTDIVPQIFNSNLYTVECNIPSIGTEFKLEKELRNKTSNIDIETNEELRKTIGEAFIGEVVKYVKAVTLKTDTGDVPVQWDNFKFADRIRIVESFGIDLLKNIVGYVNKIKEEVDKIELVQFVYEKETYTRRLSIDGNFFTIS